MGSGLGVKVSVGIGVKVSVGAGDAVAVGGRGVNDSVKGTLVAGNVAAAVSEAETVGAWPPEIVQESIVKIRRMRRYPFLFIASLYYRLFRR